MILLWGRGEDEPVRSVQRALARAGHDALLLDVDRYRDVRVDLSIAGESSSMLRVAGRKLTLSAFSSIYLRPDHPRAKSNGPGCDAGHARRCEERLVSWTESTEALAVNRLSAMAHNGSKPHQLGLIRRFGFDVPKTLVTTDPAAAADFWDAQGQVIYKSVSGVRSIVSRLTPAHRARLADVATGPTQFQAYIEGTDVRVHVVGEEVFACEIRSTATDYRYARRSDVSMRNVVLPDEFSERCRALTAGLGLHLAGLDFRRGSDGRWYCLEVNGSPGFTFYEEHTHFIADAIARLLSQAQSPPRAAECRAVELDTDRVVEPALPLED